MPPAEPKDIRNVVLVGHGDSGKTSLVEALLAAAGAIAQPGSVAAGTTVCDWLEEEKQRRYSIELSVARCVFQGITLELLDVPGYPDFAGEAMSGLVAAETAILCVNASSGVMVNTRRMWKYATEQGLARLIAINKMDLENVKAAAILSSVEEAFGPQCHPCQMPLGEGPEFGGVVPLLGPSPKLSADQQKQYDELRHKLVETIVEVDDSLLEGYLEGKPIAEEALEEALRKAILLGKVVPVLWTSAAKQLGVRELMGFVCRYTPSPLGGRKRNVRTGPEGQETELPADPSGAFRAQVFKCVSDPFVGKLAYVRIFSGSLASDGTFVISRTGKTEKVSKLYRIHGKEQSPVDRIGCGEIAAFAKIEDIATSDTLTGSANSQSFLPIPFPVPMVTQAVEPKSRSDEQRMSQSLSRMADSDPTFRVFRDSQTNELVISGMSDLHLDLSLARMKRKFDVEVATRPPKVPYRETVQAKAEGHYRHKKQTGGAGQFAEVWLKVEPKARGEGFEFADEVFGGAIPTQYIPSVEKGVRSVMVSGVISGNPMVDVKAIVYDGKDHPVDSKDIAFQIAGREAFKLAVQQARPCLLEPVVVLEVCVPGRFLGDITGDLNSRRGRILGMESSGQTQVIRAQVPLAELMRYSAQLQSITGGEGYYTLEFSHYDVVPQKLAEDIIARSSKKTE